MFKNETDDAAATDERQQNTTDWVSFALLGFERVRRARRVAVCGFRKSLIHPTVLVGWENV